MKTGESDTTAPDLIPLPSFFSSSFSLSHSLSFFFCLFLFLCFFFFFLIWISDFRFQDFRFQISGFRLRTSMFQTSNLYQDNKFHKFTRLFSTLPPSQIRNSTEYSVCTCTCPHIPYQQTHRFPALNGKSGPVHADSSPIGRCGGFSAPQGNPSLAWSRANHSCQ